MEQNAGVRAGDHGMWRCTAKGKDAKEKIRALLP